ncbi:MAG: 2-oxoacid:ferredoxin oxidoreductase subunit beta [Deltaproteobacteria bacterium]|jgi:2-oxoglutarate ferredoxin oxidoreductase subunit beta|nr:2-oxoacid:ferredoxin oxidoreductase subunit beta [Deltaproteobacteria bacterium]
MSGHIFDKYLRREKLPHMWCPGCGNGIVTQALLRAIEAAGAAQDEVVIVSGVGCSSRANGYLDFCGIHTTHGRPIAFATGVKMASPRLKVIVITGDGDCASIGGNHFIHAARRNIDLTVVVYNNSNYGMTGGQYSPTTPLGSLSKTSPLGNIEPHFDVCSLAGAAGATYVARSSTYHVQALIRQLTAAVRHNGFAVVEAMCDCPTLYGRLNRQGDAAAMLLRWKEICLPREKARSASPEELEGKIVIGEFVNSAERPEYTASYDQLIQQAKAREARA